MKKSKISNALLVASVFCSYVGLIMMFISVILNMVTLSTDSEFNLALFWYGCVSSIIGIILMLIFVIAFSEILNISWSRSFIRIHLKVSKWFIEFSDKALSGK